MSGNPTAAPLLGRMLLDRGLISEEELERALELSEATGKPIGDAVLELDLVPPTQIADLLAIQRSWRPLGWTLVERGLLSEQQLADCLDEGQSTGLRLGEVVRARGLVPHAVLEGLLAEQYQREAELERGFGAGLRGEIERRYRLKRSPGDDEGAEAAGVARVGGLESKRPLQTRLDSTPSRDGDRGASLQAAIEQRERSLDSPGTVVRRTTDEIERLREQVAERDATILALRRRLGEPDGKGRPASVHQLRPADAG